MPFLEGSPRHRIGVVATYNRRIIQEARSLLTRTRRLIVRLRDGGRKRKKKEDALDDSSSLEIGY